MAVRFILGLILFACVNNVFQELLPVTNCNKRIVRFLGGVYFFRKRLPLSNSLLMDNFSFAREVGSHLEPRIRAQYGRPGGGGGGKTLGIFGRGCAAGTLEPLAYTRATSAEFFYPLLD